VSAGSKDLFAADESTVFAKLFFDAIVVEDGKNDGGLPNPTGTNQSDWGAFLCQSYDLLDQLITSNNVPRAWRWRFSRCARRKCEKSDPSAVKTADLF